MVDNQSRPILLLCRCFTLQGTLGTWRQRPLLCACICTALLSRITQAHLVLLSVTKHRPLCPLYTQPRAHRVWARHTNGLKIVLTKAGFKHTDFVVVVQFVTSVQGVQGYETITGTTPAPASVCGLLSVVWNLLSVFPAVVESGTRKGGESCATAHRFCSALSTYIPHLDWLPTFPWLTDKMFCLQEPSRDLKIE